MEEAASVETRFRKNHEQPNLNHTTVQKAIDLIGAENVKLLKKHGLGIRKQRGA